MNPFFKLKNVNEVFDQCWRALANKGRVDAVGSQEYTRVKRNLVSGIYLRAILLDFILAHVDGRQPSGMLDGNVEARLRRELDIVPMPSPSGN